MKKFLTTLCILTVLLTGVIAPVGVDVVDAQSGYAGRTDVGGVPIDGHGDGGGGNIIANAVGNQIEKGMAVAGNAILRLVALFMGLSGLLLDQVIEHTIVNMSDNLGESPIVSETWSTIRDLANISFIFILLFIAIRTILGRGLDKKTLLNVVAVALLMNFSLFFTQVIIDAGNILSVGFYEQILEGVPEPEGIQRGAINTANNLTNSDLSTGLSGAIMQQLGLSSVYDTANGNGAEVLTKDGGFMYIFINAIGSTLIIIVATFLFLAISLMFVIRYVMLVFLMILSPVAFAAYALPGMRGRASKWFSYLVSQTFFAPIFMIMVWISLMVMGGVLPTSPGNASYSELWSAGADGQIPTDSVELALSFIVIIVLLLASLILAKSTADKSGKFTGQAGLKFAAGTIGKSGRYTAGNLGSSIRRSEWLKTKAKEGSGATRMASRLALGAGKGLSEASFDVRSGTAGKLSGAAGLAAGSAQKGGSWAESENRQKRKEQKHKDKAELLEPNKEIVARANAEFEDAKEEHAAVEEMRDNDEKVVAAKSQMDEAEKKIKDMEKAKADAQKEVSRRIADGETQERIQEAKNTLDATKANIRDNREGLEKTITEAETKLKDAESKYAEAIENAVTNRRQVAERLANIKGADEKFASKEGIEMRAGSEKERKRQFIKDAEANWFMNRPVSNLVARKFKKNTPRRLEKGVELGLADIRKQFKEKSSSETVKEIYEKMKKEKLISDESESDSASTTDEAKSEAVT